MLYETLRQRESETGDTGLFSPSPLWLKHQMKLIRQRQIQESRDQEVHDTSNNLLEFMATELGDSHSFRCLQNALDKFKEDDLLMAIHYDGKMQLPCPETVHH